ncbi:MAG: heparan-alpha-glucosaminide N-acetyltransferase domain-containing protein [Bacteroidales bacterium]
MSSVTSKNRYVALDVLRGMTIAGMILVNNPGTWSKIYPPLRHAEWFGCTPTDLVFPFFLFIVGTAMAFSFSRYLDGTLSMGSGYAKLYKRAVLIFLVGLLLNAFPFFLVKPDPGLTFWENLGSYYSHLRIFGVLQRIAMAYALGGTLALWLKKPRRIVWAFGLVLLLHWGLLYFFGGDDPYSRETNFARIMDLFLVGPGHLYRGYGLPFDPEGVLGMISGAGTVLMGYLAGICIRKSTAKIDAVGSLYTWGLVSLGAAMIWSIWLPISKPLWTASYVLYAGGWTLLLLGFFVYLIDIKGKEKWFMPFKALGLNPLFAFVMSGLFAKVFGRLIHWQTASGGTATPLGWLYNNVCVPVLGDNPAGSLAYAILYVAVFTLMAIALYKRKIIIKI